jgi:Ca2+-binding RTX toxin-like protein
MIMTKNENHKTSKQITTRKPFTPKVSDLTPPDDVNGGKGGSGNDVLLGGSGNDVISLVARGTTFSSVEVA